MTVGKFVYISSSDAAESLQLATENVKRKSFASILVRLGQLLNILLKTLLDVTAVVISAGIAVNEKQLLNIPAIVVTATVLNNGTDVNDRQALNILVILTVPVVLILNNGTDVNEKQALNILVMLLTATVSNNGTDLNE